MTDEMVYANLAEIIEFKKNNPGKTELLLGNHDLHYLFFPKFRCIGFRPEAQPALTALYLENKELFAAAFQHGNHLWTHAGVTNGWLSYNLGALEQYGFSGKNFSGTFNAMLWTDSNEILHQVGKYRGGTYWYGGITWADKRETQEDPLKDFVQYVGHSPVSEPTRMNMPGMKATVYYLDCLRSTDKMITFNVE